MSATSWHEAAAAYVLGALDEKERGEFEAQLRASSEVQRDVAELSEVVALLAYAAKPTHPPASLRARVLAEAERVRPFGAKPNVRFRARTLVPYLALAASLAAVAILGARYQEERAAGRTLAVTADSLQRALASRDVIINALLAPEVETIRLSATDRPPAARMYWNRTTGEVILAAFQLPPARPGRTYQLWGIARGGTPVSLGTFNTVASGEGRHTAKTPAGLTIAIGAVTEEPEGGSPQPTSTPFLVGQVN
ncbi:MAG TPA: anti-sigma factor [Gemmatimonadaceae bacterium]|nr:anti-sigma factor [Gemmatimonadaceae bacterium]